MRDEFYVKYYDHHQKLMTAKFCSIEEAYAFIEHYELDVFQTNIEY